MIESPPLLTLRRDFPRPTKAQIAAFQGVPSSFVCDAMNGRGALDAAIAPIGFGRDLRCVAAGPALCADNGPGDVLATFGAQEIAQPGDVVIAGFGAFQGAAAAGDRVMGMLRNAGVAGFVTDGPMRDYDGIVAAGLPCWCTGLTPNSPFANGPGRVGEDVAIGGMTVHSGDMIVADRDGVVVVPFARIAAVIARLEDIKALETELDAQVANGRKTMALTEVMIADGRAVFTDG
ncbi:MULTISPECIES: RraA family protein [unclassified Marinovum]